MIRANSIIKINRQRIEQLTQSQILALGQTAEALHTEVVQAQVMPFRTGNLQNESTFMDCSKLEQGKVSIISNTPYARRLYYHPEYQYDKTENPKAGGEWYKNWLPGGSKETFARNTYKELYHRMGGI